MISQKGFMYIAIEITETFPGDEILFISQILMTRLFILGVIFLSFSIFIVEKLQNKQLPQTLL